MCLAVPGKITEILENPLGLTMGRVSFGGVIKDVCLAWVPEVKVGDYVTVHVGFALSRIDEEEAMETFRLLEEIGELGDALESAGPPDAENPPAGSDTEGSEGIARLRGATGIGGSTGAQGIKGDHGPGKH